MTPPQYRKRVYGRLTELSEQLISFLILIIGTLLEGIYLYLLVRLHEPVDAYIDKFSLCPLKITIFIIGLSFLGLNLFTVFTFVIIHSHETFKILKKTFKKPRSRKHNNLRPPQLRAA
jgi:hypothetical protein